VDPRSIEQGNFENNSRIFPKQLFHSFPRPQQRLRFGWAKSRRQPQKKWTPTSHNPTHLSFARLGPSSPSDVPLRYHHIMPSSLERRRLPVGQGRANIRVADEPVIWSFTGEREADCHHQTPSKHPEQQKPSILKDGPTSQDEEVPRLHSNPR